MRAFRIVVLVGLALAATGTLAQAEAQFSVKSPDAVGEHYRLEVLGALWNPDPQMVIATDVLGQVTGNNTIDLVNELGITQTRFKELRATLKGSKKNKLRLDYIPISYTASATLPRTVIFNGQTYNVGLPVNTTLDWKAWRFGYEYDVISTSRGFLGIIGEVKYTDTTATLASPLRTETVAETAPIPAIGGIARVYPAKNLAGTFEMTGLNVDRSDFAVKYFDWDASGTFNFTNNVGVTAGYRSLHVTYTVDTNYGDLQLKGLYFAGVVRF